MRAWAEETPILDVLLAEPLVVRALGEAGLRGLFDLDHHLAHVDHIFARVFGPA